MPQRLQNNNRSLPFLLQKAANGSFVRHRWQRLKQRGTAFPRTFLVSPRRPTGTAKLEQDEAYEEAAYLKTNRFLAAYVVDEQSRASYVNDLLNEGFDHVRVRR